MLTLIPLQLDPDVEYEYHAPTQSPINPPYQEACQLKKHNQLAQPVGIPSAQPAGTGIASTGRDAQNAAGTASTSGDTQPAAGSGDVVPLAGSAEGNGEQGVSEHAAKQTGVAASETQGKISLADSKAGTESHVRASGDVPKATDEDNDNKALLGATGVEMEKLSLQET